MVDEIAQLARYVAHHRVCGEAIDDRYHPYNCPVRSKEGDARVTAQIRGEPYVGYVQTRAELESVRRARRNLRRQGRVLIHAKYPARTYYERPRKRPLRG